jgi:hypothetical protein
LIIFEALLFFKSKFFYNFLRYDKTILVVWIYLLQTNTLFSFNLRLKYMISTKY